LSSPFFAPSWPGLQRHGRVADAATGFGSNVVEPRAAVANLTPRQVRPASSTIVIPVLNQLDYTRQCIESLLSGGVAAESILVIDNGSSDDTPAWLAAQHDIRSIRNRVNLGCGGAWTQGALLSSCEWVVLLNNDVVVCPDGIAAMLAAADTHGFDVVSPSLVEGELDYDFESHAASFRQAMRGGARRDWFHGVCFAVRRTVFETIGFPDTDRQLGGREDVEYLVRCRRHGVPVGTVGDALLHHFGSITQKAIKQETGVRDLGDRRHFYRKLGMGWLARQGFKRDRRMQARTWSRHERRCGFSMHMIRQHGEWTHAEYL